MLWRLSPEAKSRWITRSCRSRAIRSRSRNTSNFCSVNRATSNVSETAAWTAMPCTAAIRSDVTAMLGSVHTSTKVPTLLLSVVTGKQPIWWACCSVQSRGTSRSMTDVEPSMQAASAS